MRTVSLTLLSLACVAGTASFASAAEPPANAATDAQPAVSAAEAQPALPVIVAQASAPATAAGAERRGRRERGPNGERAQRMPVHFLENKDNYWGNSIGLDSATIDADYGHTFSSLGNDSDYVGFNSAALFKLDTGLGLNMSLGYHNVFGSGPSTNNVQVGSTLLFSGDNWRGGPSFSYQNSSTGSFSTGTFTYGGYGDWFIDKNFTLSGKAGGFSWSPGDSGYYLGGQLQYYPTRNIGLGVGVDYSDYNSFNTTNISVFGEKKLSFFCAPTILQIGYTHAIESPGNFTSDTLWAHLQFLTDGNGAHSAADHDRTGTLSSFALNTMYR